MEIGSSVPIIISLPLAVLIWIDPLGAYPSPLTSASRLLKYSSLTVISFFVRVPVLSERMTVVEPSVSTLESCFIIAFFFAKRFTPMANAIVIVVGRPSGTAATATETAKSRFSMKGLPW